MTIRVTHLPTRAADIMFSELNIGDFFRYVDPTSRSDIYIKTAYGYGTNVIHVNKGNSYPVSHDRPVVKQDVLITVSDSDE